MTLKRNDHAVITGVDGSNPETVRIVRAENITLGTGSPEWPLHTERWLHVEFPDGARLLAHPSNLAPVSPLDTLRTALVGMAAAR